METNPIHVHGSELNIIKMVILPNLWIRCNPIRIPGNFFVKID